jgi:hypothetical protein
MNDDPIVDEVHRVREEMLAEFNGDFEALVKNFQKRTAESAAAGRRVVALPPRPAGQPALVKKVG